MTQYDETKLLCDALLFEHGHARRTQHILKVYALAKLIGEAQRLPAWEQRIVQAAAILHDIAIGPCKQKYGEATQDKQRREAPALVRRFLRAAGYPKRTSRASCIWCRAITHTTALTGWISRSWSRPI